MRFKRFCALSFSIGIICFVINHLCSEGLLRYAMLRFTIPCALRFASVAYLNALKRLMRLFLLVFQCVKKRVIIFSTLGNCIS